MTVQKSSKIQYLLQSQPSHTVFVSSHLEQLGYSSSLRQHYVESGWFQRLGLGAMVRTGDSVSWQGLVYSLQQYAQIPVYVGGLSALTMHGKAHYIRFADNSIHLFAPINTKLPKWSRHPSLEIALHLHTTSMLPPTLGIITMRSEGFDVLVSSEARALMECLHLSPQHFDLVEAFHIMESLSTLIPRHVQALLEACTSIKVKRLFLYLARKAEHRWLDYLDTDKLTLGSGVRTITPKGIYVPEDQLMLPVNLVEAI